MIRKILIILSIFALTSCSYLRVHKMDIEQGNILLAEDVSRIHVGMSESSVVRILGNPVLKNIFKDNQFNYVYTYKPGNGVMHENYVVVYFRSGVVSDIKTNMT